MDVPVIDRAVAVQSEAANLTFEEAGFLAFGALIDIYGLDTDPVPVSVDGDIVEYRGQRVWRLGVSVEWTKTCSGTSTCGGCGSAHLPTDPRRPAGTTTLVKVRLTYREEW